MTTQLLRVINCVIETLRLDSVHRRLNMADPIKDFPYKVPISAADTKMEEQRWSVGEKSISRSPALVA